MDSKFFKNKKIKILMINPKKAVGGGQKISYIIAKKLKTQFKFHFIYTDKPGILGNIIALYKNIKSKNPDIIHIHGIRPGFYFKILCFFSKIARNSKNIYTLHGIHFFHRGLFFKKIYYLFEKITNYLFIDAVVCVGKDDFNLAKKINLVYQDKLFLIENGIDIKEYKPNYKKIKILKNKFKKNFVILTISRLSLQKDITTTIKGMKILQRKKRNISLLIIGKGGQERFSKTLTKKLKLEKQIIFLGKKQDVENYYKIADVFVLSTKWEGLPLVILESMYFKVPVVASNSHGIKGLIKNKINGLVFRQGSPYDLAKKIEIILKNKNLKNKIIKNAHTIVLKKYNSKLMTEKYKRLYTKLAYENFTNK